MKLQKLRLEGFLRQQGLEFVYPSPEQCEVIASMTSAEPFEANVEGNMQSRFWKHTEEELTKNKLRRAAIAQEAPKSKQKQRKKHTQRRRQQLSKEQSEKRSKQKAKKQKQKDFLCQKKHPPLYLHKNQRDLFYKYG